MRKNYLKFYYFSLDIILKIIYVFKNELKFFYIHRFNQFFLRIFKKNVLKNSLYFKKFSIFNLINITMNFLQYNINILFVVILSKYIHIYANINVYK